MFFGVAESAFGKCSFCLRSRDDADEKILLFGRNTSGKDVSICTGCVNDCIRIAEKKPTYVGGKTESYVCDICGESVAEIDQIFLRNEKGVCASCISYFVKVSLTVGKRPGVTRF